MTRAVRIDTIRNQSAATRDLMAMVEQHLADLHELAYNRYIAARDIAVAGGDRDYALDTHGDPRARDAYRTLSHIHAHVCTTLAEAHHDALCILRDGDIGQARGRRRIEAEELALAIANRAVRIAAGDYEPVALIPQPEGRPEDLKRTIDRLVRERDEARALAARQARQLAELTPPEPPARRGWHRHRRTPP